MTEIQDTGAGRIDNEKDGARQTEVTAQDPDSIFAAPLEETKGDDNDSWGLWRSTGKTKSASKGSDRILAVPSDEKKTVDDWGDFLKKKKKKSARKTKTEQILQLTPHLKKSKTMVITG